MKDSIFKKSGYLRVLFVGLPFGIGSLIVGLPMFKSIPNSSNELILHEGRVVDFGETKYYSEDIDFEHETFFIRISSNKFYTDRRKEREIIENTDYRIGDKIKIWTKPNNLYISQLKLNDQMIMKYKPPYWIAWSFTIFGAIFSVMCIYVLIADRSEFF